MWQQRATSAEDRQKGCLANGRKMEEPRWLQSWFGKSEGRVSVTFIYYLHGSVLCRKERKRVPRKSKQKRGKER